MFRAEETMELTVADNGIGLDGVSGHSGLGSRIIHLLTQQLGGTLVYEKLESGCKATLRAPRTNASGSEEARRTRLPAFSNATAAPRDALSS